MMRWQCFKVKKYVIGIADKAKVIENARVRFGSDALCAALLDFTGFFRGARL
jgi:hypothetical protein